MELLHLFEHAADLDEYTDGQIVFAEGEAGDRMLVVVEGAIDISVGATTLFRAEAGEIVGEMALIDDEPRSATATARGRTRVASVDRDRFLFMVQQTPFFSLHVMRVLADRLRRMDRRL